MRPILLLAIPVLFSCQAVTGGEDAPAIQSARANQPVAMIPSTLESATEPCRATKTAANTEAIDLLQGTTTNGVLDDETIDTATLALRLLRQSDARAANMPVRKVSGPELLLAPDAALIARLVALDAQRSSSGEPIGVTGSGQLDALNAKWRASLGACYFSCRKVTLHFQCPVDAVGIAATYRSLESVRQALPNFYGGQSRGIGITEIGSVWKMVVYEGWGDCPAGCIYHHKTFYDYDPGSQSLTRTGEERRIPPPTADASPLIADLPGR